MKLIIQIPCFNEEASLPVTIQSLPKTVAGFRQVEFLVINDGSSDRTLEVARGLGVPHIVDLPVNKGLAAAFMAGVERALMEGADVIVNTDADNQYDARDIEALVGPIVRRQASFVVGTRPIASMDHFSRMRKILQYLGSWVVRFTSGTEVRDAPSGFRAFTRDVALRMNVFDGYTYTLESIIQAGRNGTKIVSVPIRVNGETRPSRLMRSVPQYVLRSTISILRAFLVYSPSLVFIVLGALPVALGSALALRWLILFIEGTERAHVPSLVAAAVLLLSGILIWLFALIGEVLGINRRLLEDVQFHLRRERTERQRERAETSLPKAVGKIANVA